MKSPLPGLKPLILSCTMIACGAEKPAQIGGTGDADARLRTIIDLYVPPPKRGTVVLRPGQEPGYFLKAWSADPPCAGEDPVTKAAPMPRDGRVQFDMNQACNFKLEFAVGVYTPDGDHDADAGPDDDGGDDHPDGDTGTPAPPPDWQGSMAALLAKNCGSCHGSAKDGRSPDLSDYKTAKANGLKILRMVESGRMPPEDPLAPESVQLIRAWKEAGFPRTGDNSGGTNDNDHDNDSENDNKPPSPGVTWYGQLEAISQRHCISCHRRGGSRAVSDLTQKSTIEARARQIVAEVVRGDMPTSAPLSDQEMDLFRQWEADGYPMGRATALLTDGERGEDGQGEDPPARVEDFLNPIWFRTDEPRTISKREVKGKAKYFMEVSWQED